MSAFLDSLTPSIVFTGLAEIASREYCYHVVRQDFKPELPNFAGIDEEVLFVSDSVPEQDRQHIFWHEVMCVIHRKRRGCAQTLKEELDHVPQEQRHGYIERRCKFFEALVAFYAKRPPAFYEEIVASYQYLMSLLEG